jgi:cyanophycinase-like exopeptidase
MKPDCRILAIMGSGETSPTMVTIHKAVIDRLGSGRPDALLMDTPYAFQENAADISSRAISYFATSVGLDVKVLTSPDGVAAAEAVDTAGTAEAARTNDAARARSADWVFAGPGSPSYALTRWRDRPLGQALRERIASGTGVTVLASAAAATAGVTAVPVYEIYKVGEPPHWLPGLDLLAAADLRVAVIPHYDNAEGGTHDTRFCYLGERRLAMMEGELPPDAAVLGVDEHTAVIFDLVADTAEVRGRGGLTIRKNGASTVLRAPAVLPIGDLRATIRTGTLRVTNAAPPAPVPGQSETDSPLPLTDVVERAEREFEAALADRDGKGLIMIILDLEYAVHAWMGDTDEDQGTEQARAVLRGMIGRLDEFVTEGLRDPLDKLRPAVEPLVGLRSVLRAQGRYAESDAIRAALAACGVQIADDADGSRWSVDSSTP